MEHSYSAFKTQSQVSSSSMTSHVDQASWGTSVYECTVALSQTLTWY
jgi:hypothetical protein